MACLAVVGVAACSTGTTSGPVPAPALSNNGYRQVNLAANAEAYQACFTMPEMVNTWGIAIRPRAGQLRHAVGRRLRRATADPPVQQGLRTRTTQGFTNPFATGDPAKGKLAEFTSTGELVRAFEDDGRLNAPWGATVAPASFGPLGKVLVSNFGGAGRIAAFDDTNG